MTPPFESTFDSHSFDLSDCEEIKGDVLDDAKVFVSFMKTMIEDILGKEDQVA